MPLDAAGRAAGALSGGAEVGARDVTRSVGER